MVLLFKLHSADENRVICSEKNVDLAVILTG